MKCPKKCIDCGKEINKVSIRCKSCSNKNRKGKFKQSEEAKKSKLGEKNPVWKGNNVSYGALHDYIKWHKIKIIFCEECRKKRSFDLANITGKYTRNPDDYKWLCRSCHTKLDFKLGIRVPRGRVKILKI
jgi:uncharacterized protein YlaI